MTYIYLVEAIVNDPSIMHGDCYRSQLDNFIMAEIHALNVVKLWLNVAKLVKGLKLDCDAFIRILEANALLE